MHLEAMTVSMCSEKGPFLIKHDLSTSFEVSLEEIRMFLSKYRRHQNVNRVSNNLSLAISKHLGEALTSFQNFTD